MKTVKLGKIATIRTAKLYREKAPILSESGNIRGLTIKDIVSNWPIDWEALPSIETDENKDLSNFLNGGEVLIPGRGDKYPARYFQASSKMIFPHGHIYIISCNQEVIGRYLCWYINQSKTQNKINQSLTGTNIKALIPSRLSELEIAIPPLKIQNAIADLQELREVKELFATLEKQEIEWACRKLLHKNSRNDDVKSN